MSVDKSETRPLWRGFLCNSTDSSISSKQRDTEDGRRKTCFFSQLSQLLDS